VRCLYFEENTLFTGSFDNTVKMWDLESLQCTQTLQGHNKGVRCLAVDHERLVIGSRDGMVSVWPLRSVPMERCVVLWDPLAPEIPPTAAGEGGGQVHGLVPEDQPNDVPGVAGEEEEEPVPEIGTSPQPNPLFPGNSGGSQMQSTGEGSGGLDSEGTEVDDDVDADAAAGNGAVVETGPESVEGNEDPGMETVSTEFDFGTAPSVDNPSLMNDYYSVQIDFRRVVIGSSDSCLKIWDFDIPS